MSLTVCERQIVRDLARRVAEIGAHPRHAAQREMWKRHNRLERVKPMVLIFPEGAWSELLPDDVLQVADPFFRGLEWHLRHLIYRWEHLRDDNVIEPQIRVGLVCSNSGWGLPIENIPSTTARGAWAFKPAIKEPEDLAKMKFPVLTVDEEQTRRNFEAMSDAIGDILTVKIHRRPPVETSLIGTLARLRGLDQIMLDMCERPRWVHQAMSFMTEGTMGLLDHVESLGIWDLNNGADYVGSGGVGYTDELPAPGYNGKPRLRDLWGFAEAQEMAGVSPRMLDEFVLQYQARMLDRFGLNCYGCCESLTHKLEVVKKVPHLRRVSVSPWTDVRVAAEGLQGRYIFSWKPNPTDMLATTDTHFIRRRISETVKIAEGCVFEMILKDTHTTYHEPQRLENWVRIANEVASG
jgi:hypothetical protein